MAVTAYLICSLSTFWLNFYLDEKNQHYSKVKGLCRTILFCKNDRDHVGFVRGTATITHSVPFREIYFDLKSVEVPITCRSTELKDFCRTINFVFSLQLHARGDVCSWTCRSLESV